MVLMAVERMQDTMRRGWNMKMVDPFNVWDGLGKIVMMIISTDDRAVR